MKNGLLIKSKHITRNMLKKWKLLDSELVLNEKWYQVRKDTVEVKPGKIINDYYLSLSNDIVLIVALTADKKIPLVRQYKHGAGEILIELPGGYVDDNEEPLAAAQRELREETGFTATIWHSLGDFYKNSGKTKGGRTHLFLALNASRTSSQKLDDNEIIEVIMTPFKKALADAWQGNIEGEDSTLALLLADKKEHEKR